MPELSREMLAEQLEQRRRSIRMLEYEYSQLAHRKENRPGQLLFASLGVLLGGFIGYIFGESGTEIILSLWFLIPLCALIGLVLGMLAFRQLPSQRRLLDVEKLLTEYKGSLYP